MFAAAVENEGGPAGFTLRLDGRLDNGTAMRVVTDSSWRSSLLPDTDAWRELAFDAAEWLPAQSFGSTAAPE